MARTEQTTLGDLIVALTDETGRFIRDENEIYEVVSFIVSDLYKSRLVQKQTECRNASRDQDALLDG
ncbi:MAG TPA: hypothetical protein VGL70_24075 [Candidatus Binatia bacterium]|jgi:hypothetical protein